MLDRARQPSRYRRRSGPLRFVIVLAILSLPGTGAAQEEPPDAERLYISKGCLGCHGASGRGGVGPALAQTGLSFDAFIEQLRAPRAIMPEFPAEIVSEAEARLIYDYLREVPPPVPTIRERMAEQAVQPLPAGEVDAVRCAGCHERIHGTIVRQFFASAMGRTGTQNARIEYPQRRIGCADCHGTDHDVIMATKGRVPEAKCASCHPRIYKEHVVDGGHSYGPGPGGIGINWERNIGVPHYEQMPRKVMEMGCDPCHAQAGATAPEYWSDEQGQYIDTSSLTYRNGCMACHTRHSFSLVEARKPEACYTCHMGPDHPNYEAYMSSKHGSIYAARGDDWDWTTPLAAADWDAPTCAYCHMLYVADDGTRSSSHNMTRKIIWGMGVQPATGQLEDITLTEESQAKRDEMVKVCMSCHSEDKARGYLKSADAHKLAGDALVVEARDILTGLYEEDLIEPSHGRRAAGLLPGPTFTAVDLPTEFAMHWPAGLYYNVSSIEREYFDMFFFSNLKSYKGAFHMSPDYSWWYGYADVLGHLARIRDEAQGLREAEATQDRTLFMIFTGPFMVLAVLGAVYLIWRFVGHRRRESAG